LSSEVDIGEKLTELQKLLQGIDPNIWVDTSGSAGEIDYVMDNEAGYVSDDVGEALSDLRDNLLNLSTDETMEMWKSEAEAQAAREEAEKQRKELEKQLSKAKMTIAELKTAFAAGVITEASFRAELAARGYKAFDIDAMVATEKKRTVSPAEKVKILPTLTLADLKTAFRMAVISEDDLRAELLNRGYALANIDIIIGLEKAKIAALEPKGDAKDQVNELVVKAARSGELTAKKKLKGRILIEEADEIEELQALKSLVLRMAFGMINAIPSEEAADVIKVLSDEGKDLFALYKEIKAVLGEVE